MFSTGFCVDGQLYAWGNINNTNKTSRPMLMTDYLKTKIQKIKVNQDVAMALDFYGTLYSWSWC